MTTRNRLKAAGTAALALGLASLAPQPAETQPTLKDGCPVVDYGGNVRPEGTDATRTLSYLGAYLLGAMDAACDSRAPGETFAAHREADGQVTVAYMRTVESAGALAARHDYSFSITAHANGRGALDPGAITTYSVQKDTSHGPKGGTEFSLHAEYVDTGWWVDVAQLQGNDVYVYGANTGASLASEQADQLAHQAAYTLAESLHALPTISAFGDIA